MARPSSVRAGRSALVIPASPGEANTATTSGHAHRESAPAERQWPRLEAELDDARLRPLTALIARLRRTKLGRWMLGYFAFAWLALQMTDALREIWSWPAGLPRGITLALALGALPTGVVAWYHGERGRQKVCMVELAVLGAMLLVSAWLIWILCA